MNTHKNIRKKIQIHIENMVGNVQGACPLSYWYKRKDGVYVFVYLHNGQEIACCLNEAEGSLWSISLGSYERKVN